LPKGVEFRRGSGSAVKQETDPYDLLCLLRLGSERRSKENRTSTSNERSSVHYWITSPARSCRECGIVRPSGSSWAAVSNAL
jgi:hypothetical protein